LIRTCCTSYSLRDRFNQGAFTLEDFIIFCGTSGFDGVELHNMHFSETRHEYLNKLKSLTETFNLEIVCVGASNNFAVQDKDELKRQIEHVKRWVTVASELEAPVVRVFVGHVRLETNLEKLKAQAIEALKECAVYAEEMGVTLGIENHGNFCNGADEIIKIMDTIGLPSLKALPDVGNFLKDRYEQLRMLAPFAVHVHAKMLEFDESGNERNFDYQRVADIFKNAGFNGYFSIKYEGKGEQMESVKKGLALLKRIINEP